MKNDIYEGKDFIFTIFDDTDRATLENIKPVYDFLSEKGLKTTKSIFVLEPKNNFDYEEVTLEDKNYLNYLQNLEKKGFEIAYHGAGNGNYTKEEINKAINVFKKAFKNPSKIYVNHDHNLNNIYWGSKRFSFPFNFLYRMIDRTKFEGDTKRSPNYWGDICKKEFKYIRNYTFDSINTLSRDRYMPYLEKRKTDCSNYWFSSTDCLNLEKFLKIVTKKNIDLLEKEKGICIIYTHFADGFYDKNKKSLNKDFIEIINYLVSKNGLFITCGELLDKLNEKKVLKYTQKLHLDINYFYDRIKRIMK